MNSVVHRSIARRRAIMRVALALMLLSAGGPSAAKDTAPKRPVVTMNEFFLYSCVQAYQKANSLPLFDSSQSYAVEYSTVPPEVLGRVYEAASAFARSLPAPNLADQEHGGVAVLAQCLKQSQSPRIRHLAAEADK